MNIFSKNDINEISNNAKTLMEEIDDFSSNVVSILENLNDEFEERFDYLDSKKD